MAAEWFRLIIGSMIIESLEIVPVIAIFILIHPW